MLSSDTAQLAALFVESVLYGVYLVTFGYCLQALFRSPSGWKRPDEIKLVPLSVALSLFCAGTINLVFGFYQILDVQEHRASNVRYLGKPWLNIVQTSTITVEVLIADGALIYRCWQVYEKTWNLRLIRAFDLECITFWVITIVLNIYATGMIVFRICQADRRIPSTAQRPTKLQDDMMVIGIAFNLIIFQPDNTDPKSLTIIEFNHDLSLAAHPRNPSSEACHVGIRQGSAENIV
ncbi:hypothetical protein BJ912DRAFT_980199 [Pholiota molesta]|nr:hypothetical protein BJ912DRAFT_980199 [Pholiota molesta]